MVKKEKSGCTGLTYSTKRVGQHLRRVLVVAAFLTAFLPHTASSQHEWSLSFPAEARYGHFFIEAPKNTDKFYLFGNAVQALDPNTLSLGTMPPLPDDVLPKENNTGYTAPYRRMDLFSWDAQKWWMVYEGRILKTTDGGDNWREVLSLAPNTTYSNSNYFTSIHFPSENVGYAVGTADKIFRTVDGGENWEVLQWSTSTAPYRRLSNVYFVTESVGFASGYEVDDILLNIGIYTPLYYFTTDGGHSWTETTFPESDHHYVELQVVEQTTWYLSLTNRNFIAPNDQLYKSTDGGVNWTEIDLPGSSPLSSLVLRGMHWFSPDEGVLLGSTELFGSPNHIYKTYDGGQSWQEILLDPGSTAFFTKISNIALAFKGDRGVIGGATGNVLYTDDQGETWQQIQSGFPDAHDLSSHAGNTYVALYGNALLKHDGTDWAELPAPANSRYQVAAFDKVSNYGADQVALKDIYGEIHYSQNGGNNWTSFFDSLENRVLDIQFVQGKLAALVYSNNQLHYYSEVQDSQSKEIIIDGTPLPATIFDLFQVGDQVFARVESFLFRRNHGNWEQLFFNNAFIRSLQMDRSGNALMQFQDRAYYYSNDTGNTWQIATFSADILRRIDFEISQVNGYGALNDTLHYLLVHGTPDIRERYQTSLLISTDRGANWELADFARFAEPNELGRIGHAVDENGRLWIGSALGNLYQWQIEDTTTGIEIPVLADITIFPNPTNGVLNVQTPAVFELFQLFDGQGQLVISGSLNGQTNIEMPPHCARGIYVLQLITNSGTKKVLKVVKQ